MLTLTLVAILISLFSVKSNVTPTKWNAMEEFYIASNASENFQSNNITCKSPYCHITCDEANSCQGTNINGSAASTLIVECTATESCKSVYIHSTLPINILNIHCLMGGNVCNQMRINAIILENANINCIYSKSCQYAVANLTMASSDANVKINCSKSLYNLQENNGSCLGSQFNIDGYIENMNNMQASNNNNNSVLLTCQEYDCFDAKLILKHLNSININCDHQSACQDMMVKAWTSDRLDMECGTMQSCYSTDIYCPSINQESCNINCSATYGCFIMAILVDEMYNYGFLDLSCPGQNSCLGQSFHCVGDILDKKGTVRHWNETLQDWLCQNADFTLCCPDTPDPIPTQIPTGDPTQIPTLTPSLIPTSTPSSTPSLIPTLTPTLIPTLTTQIAAVSVVVSSADSSTDNVIINTTDPLFIVVMIIALIDIIIIAFCIRYILTNLLIRTRMPGNVRIPKAIKTLLWWQYLYIIFEIFDITTDYLYGVSLITSNQYTLFVLGWISLIFAIFGVAMFFFKYSTYRKLFGYQVSKYEKQLTLYSSDRTKCIRLVEKIRIRTMDIDVVSLLNGCLEDIPQTLIVLISSTNSKWNAFGVLSITLSMMSFSLKLSQIIALKLGCKDHELPQDIHRQSTVTMARQIEQNPPLSIEEDEP